MPVYEKSRGKWRVRIFHKGQRRDWIVEGAKTDAEAFEARQRVALEQGDPVPSRSVPSFSDFCLSHYRHHAETHLRASTWSVRKYQLATLYEHIGELKLTDITTAAVEAYKTKRRKQDAKPRTVNNELAVLQAVRTYARKLGVPTANATIDPLPVIGRGRVTFWTGAQLASLFTSVQEHAPEILPIVLFLVNTGCRKGEALALEWRCVDVKRRIITIEPNEDWQPKDNEPREIPISSGLLPYLKRTQLGRYVFPSGTGDRYAYWPKLQFDRARKAADLKGGPHTLRHTFASHFLKNKPDIFLLSKILGHSETRTTRLYSHLLPDHLAAARNAVSFSVPLRKVRTPKRRETVPRTVPAGGCALGTESRILERFQRWT